jgi:hypothetical protein
MDDLQIHYRGFSPSEFPKHYIRCLMEQLRDEAPSAANVRISISKSGENAFCGQIRITSGSGPFVVTASGAKLMNVVHTLLERVRAQLEHWKANRFTGERDFAVNGGKYDRQKQTS